MKDRVPKYPGRVKMTPVAGQENTFDMVRADEPAEAGTPINKATLLTDETAVSLGLATEGATVDAGLKLLADSPLRVGDIKYTLRAAPSDKWLLCNGTEIKKEDYPDLYDKLDVACFNASDNNYYGQVATGGTMGAYDNTAYIFSKFNFENYYSRMAADMTTKVETKRPDSLPSAREMVVLNGTPVLLGTNGYIYINAGFPVSETWTPIQIKSNFNYYILSGVYINGYYVFLTGSGGFPVVGPFLLYSDTLTGPYTAITLSVNVSSMCYNPDKNIAVMRTSSGFMTFSDPTGVITTITNSAKPACGLISYKGGAYILYGASSYYSYGSDLSVNFADVKTDLPDGSGQYDYRLLFLTEIDGILGGMYLCNNSNYLFDVYAVAMNNLGDSVLKKLKLGTANFGSYAGPVNNLEWFSYNLPVIGNRAALYLPGLYSGDYGGYEEIFAADIGKLLPTNESAEYKFIKAKE